MVSAPSSGVRRNGPVTLRKPGSDSATPGVSAQPGCIEWNTTPESANRAAHCSVSAT